MSSIRRPRARWKPPAEPPLQGAIDPSSVNPAQAIPYFENLQAICDLTGWIERWIEGDNGKQDILLRTISLSRWFLAETETLSPNTALRTLMIFVEGYKSLLQIILRHLQEGRTMNPELEKGLNAQLDVYLEVFRERFFVARSAGSYVQPAGGGSSKNLGFFRKARNFIITGGNFMSHIPDTNLQEICEEILQSVSDGNSAVLHDDIVRLQGVSEMTLRAVRFNIIVLFY